MNIGSKNDVDNAAKSLFFHSGFYLGYNACRGHVLILISLLRKGCVKTGNGKLCRTKRSMTKCCPLGRERRYEATVAAARRARNGGESSVMSILLEFESEIMLITAIIEQFAFKIPKETGDCLLKALPSAPAPLRRLSLRADNKALNFVIDSFSGDFGASLSGNGGASSAQESAREGRG